jgi:hypothetical protein
VLLILAEVSAKGGSIVFPKFSRPLPLYCVHTLWIAPWGPSQNAGDAKKRRNTMVSSDPLKKTKEIMIFTLV